MHDEVMVSVLCLAYNHEAYLSECLDSLVSQRTSFSYEVIVHDDCSTDGTSAIVEQYKTQYPSTVRSLRPKDNLYCSIGLPAIYRSALYPIARGKYIAYCEGDDYWSDPLKLQKQVEILERFPDCHMCCHKTQLVNSDGSLKEGEFFPQTWMPSGTYNSHDFMKGLTDGYFFHTSSFMCRKSDIDQYRSDPPAFYLESDLDDVPLLLLFGSLGNNYYLDEAMSCYRRNSVGSWTEGQAGNRDKIISHKQRMIRMYEQYDLYTNGKYSDLVGHWIDNESFMIAEIRHDFKEMSKKKYRIFVANRSIKFKLMVLFASLLPRRVLAEVRNGQ